MVFYLSGSSGTQIRTWSTVDIDLRCFNLRTLIFAFDFMGFSTLIIISLDVRRSFLVDSWWDVSLSMSSGYFIWSIKLLGYYWILHCSEFLRNWLPFWGPSCTAPWRCTCFLQPLSQLYLPVENNYTSFGHGFSYLFGAFLSDSVSRKSPIG